MAGTKIVSEGELFFMRQSVEKMDEAVQLLKEIAVEQREATKGLDRRVQLIEENAQLFRKEIQENQEKTWAKLEPIKKHVDLVNSLCKIFTASISAAGTVLGIMKLFSIMHGAQ